MCFRDKPLSVSALYKNKYKRNESVFETIIYNVTGTAPGR